MKGDGPLSWLEPNNDLAQTIIDLDVNSFYRVKKEDGRTVLRVGLQTSGKIPGRLISFGRDLPSNDVILLGLMFSKNQCHLYFNRYSSALILRDTSSTKSTRVKRPDVVNDRIYQLQGDPRQRVLLPAHQIHIIIGRAEFRIDWRN